MSDAKRKNHDPAAEQSRLRRETFAAFLVVFLSVPFLYSFARAATDAEGRRREGPLRALVGEKAYAAYRTGTTSPIHYMGRNRRVPEFSLNDRSGTAWRMSAQRGKVVVLNFWSITCPPCIEEMPSVVELGRVYRGARDVEIAAVSTDAGWGAVRSLFPAEPPLRVLFDPGKRIVGEKFGTRLFPETWLIDKRGIIRARVDGPRDWSSPLVREIIDALRRE